jgi:hypothetical protein
MAQNCKQRQQVIAEWKLYETADIETIANSNRGCFTSHISIGWFGTTI